MGVYEQIVDWRKGKKHQKSQAGNAEPFERTSIFSKMKEIALKIKRISTKYND
jgi:hypothetical protein